MSESSSTDRSLDGLEASQASSSRRRRWLVALACAETLTLAVLVANLGLLGHNPQLTRMIGPIHGCLYVAGVLLTLTGRFPRLVKAAAFVPLVGVWTAVEVARRQVVDARARS